MRIPLYQIDAFADGPFTGNPAAVCPLESWLPDAVMQAIAAENNLSETAFFVPEGEFYRLRWFTPLTEVDLCGHATLASAFVVFRWLSPERRSITFQTQQAGPLTVARDGDLLALDFPSRPPMPCAMSEPLVAALGPRPAALLAARDYLAVYESADDIAALAPDFAALAALDRFAVIVTAPGTGGVDFVSRFFAPAAGVNEDPVTGSAHCTLIPYWAQRLGKNRLEARQLSRRGGALFCACNGDRVTIAGRALPYLEGTITIRSAPCGGNTRTIPLSASECWVKLGKRRGASNSEDGVIYYRPQSPKRRNLVILRGGNASIHRQWIDQGEPCDRNWDLLISYFGDDNTFARTFEDMVLVQGSHKYNAIYELLCRYDVLWNYSNFWLPDDDVLLSWQAINRLFDVFDEFQLLLAQPALSLDSFSAHQITVVDERYLLRFSTFVEVMAPLFSAASLKRLLHTFEGAVTSWGLDYIWPHLLDLPRNRIAIIDEVVMRHTKQVGAGAFYDRPSAEAEMSANLAKYGVAGRLQRIWGGIFKG